jgi:HD-GYP domain-containing protein (c-di-GMP phosphodiesterase class II)
VASWGEPFESLANVIAQEHERFDGRGYPLGLQGEDICLEARILGLVDTYEAMTHFRPFKLTHSPHWAMKTILAVTSHLFGPNLLNLIVRRFTLYPIGSVVELSSMEQGVVVGLNHDEPMRPHVYVACGRQGWKSPYPRVVNLKEYPLLHITRSLTLPGTNDPVVQNQAVSL